MKADEPIAKPPFFVTPAFTGVTFESRYFSLSLCHWDWIDKTNEKLAAIDP